MIEGNDIMKLIRTEDAVGCVLCHDITQIIRGVTKDAVFRKGHIVREEDIPVLLSVGKEHLYVWESDENTLHENEAAKVLRDICMGKNMHPTEPKEGKIELIADIDGLFIADIQRLRAVNSLGRMMIATRSSGFPVRAGDKLCGTRIIPLMIEKQAMEQARAAAGEEPILRLLPIKQKKYGVVATGSEISKGIIEDTFTPVIEEKMREYGCTMIACSRPGDDDGAIAASIKDMIGAGAEVVICTGGMSVDPDDRTPLAIRKSGGRVVAYGAPVLPGAMFMLSYNENGIPVCGLPGCVMYARRTIFDIVLPYLLADEPVTAELLSGLGNGGLCLNCKECHYPNCGFGKGA